MKLYRYICIYEYKELMRNGFVETRNPVNSFTSRNNSAVSPNKGIFFALKEGKGFYTYMSRENSFPGNYTFSPRSGRILAVWALDSYIMLSKLI